MIKEGHIFKSEHHDIQLKLISLEEPNNGRMQWRFQFLVNGKLIDNRFINTDSYLLSNLKDYTFESIDKNYIFIPREYQSVVYDLKRNVFIELSRSSADRNNNYIGNYFTENKLVVNYTREVMIFDLDNHNCISVNFPFGKYQIKESRLKENKFIITYKDLNDYQIYTREYDFNLMDFKKNKS